MSYLSHDCANLAELRNVSMAAAADAQRRGRHVALIVSDNVNADFRKAELALNVPVGVEVLSYASWLEGLWELWGNGTAIVNPDEREMLLRPIMRSFLSMEPSVEYVNRLGAFIRDAYGCSWEGIELSPEEQHVKAAAVGFELVLASRGLSEELQVAQSLARMDLGDYTFIFEDGVLNSYARKETARLLSENCEVVACTRTVKAHLEAPADASDELQQLRCALYRGRGGLKPTGKVRLLQIKGCHAQEEALAQNVADLVSKRSACSVALCVAGDSRLYERLAIELAQASVPFEFSYSDKMQRTYFGKMLLNILKARWSAWEAGCGGAAGEGCAELEAFVRSPYSGLRTATAEGLVTQWRHDGSEINERMTHLFEGAKGNVNRKTWLELLEHVEPFARIDASLEELVRTMFENAKAVCKDPNQLLDDQAAAMTALDYFQMCKDLVLEPSSKELAELQVPLNRSHGEDPLVQLVAPSQISCGVWGCLVLGSLDAKHFSMASTDSPFDNLARKLSVFYREDEAQIKRLQLLEMLESTRDCALLFFVANDSMGNEQCASALWDEVLEAYCAPSQEEEGIAGNEAVFEGLQTAGAALSVCEKELFSIDASLRQELWFEPCQGVLRRPDAVSLLPTDSKEFGEAFSPTALEDYYRCPYRWFICRRIGAQPLDAEFNNIAKGNLAHAVLDRFYKKWTEELKFERVTSENLEDALVVASGVFDWQVAHEIEKRRLVLKGKQDSYGCQKVKEQVLDLIARDAEFLPGFAPRFLELELKEEDGMPMTYAGVPVRGKVDRIDVDARGRAVIIDYKLSGLSTGYGFKGAEELPARIQTDIYAKLVQTYFEEHGLNLTVVGSVYRSYAKNSLRGVYAKGIDWGGMESVKESQDQLPNLDHEISYNDYLVKVEDAVRQCMERLYQGVITPQPLEGDVCQFCLALNHCKEAR